MANIYKDQSEIERDAIIYHEFPLFYLKDKYFYNN